MQRIFMVLVLLGSLALAGEARAEEAAATGRLVKVLPFLLNLKGHDSLAPSLFDRDAYQMYLRLHTNEISAVRYDVLCKISGPAETRAKVQIELRAVGPDGNPKLKTLEAAVKPTLFRHWISLNLAGDEYIKLGHVVAWRTTLWSGGKLLGEQKSFLW